DSLPPGSAAPPHPAGRLPQPRAALPLAREDRPCRGRAATRPGRAVRRSALGGLRGDGDPGRARVRRRRPQGLLMDLSTEYLGLTLRNPLVASASPLSQTVDG